MHRLLFFTPGCLFVSACSGGEGEGSASLATSNSSEVSDVYRKSFDKAWQSAGEGRSPTGACASVVGTAVGLLQTTATKGQERDNALAALNACYVTAMARFVETKLSVENPRTKECVSLLTALPIHRSSLGSFFNDVGEDVATYDARLNAKIDAKVRSACPDTADVILGT